MTDKEGFKNALREIVPDRANLELFLHGCDLVTYPPAWEDITEQFYKKEDGWDVDKIRLNFQIAKFRFYDVAHAIVHETYPLDGQRKRYQMSPDGLIIKEGYGWLIQESEDFADEAPAPFSFDIQKGKPSVSLKERPPTEHDGGAGWKVRGLATMEQIQQANWWLLPVQMFRVIGADGVMLGRPVRRTVTRRSLIGSVPLRRWVLEWTQE